MHDVEMETDFSGEFCQNLEYGYLVNINFTLKASEYDCFGVLEIRLPCQTKNAILP